MSGALIIWDEIEEFEKNSSLQYFPKRFKRKELHFCKKCHGLLPDGQVAGVCPDCRFGGELVFQHLVPVSSECQKYLESLKESAKLELVQPELF